MSWSSGAEAAGETGSAAGSAGGGASSLGSMGGASGAAGMYGQMADVGGSGAGAGTTGAGAGTTGAGFSSALDGAGSAADTGPSLASQYADTGSTGGSMMDRTMHGLEQFQKGGQQSLPEAYRSWGNNPATYGYLAGKLQSMGGGGGPQATNMTTNISYQQPQNDYLAKQRRRF